ncbi:DUF4328 domain-containing protein [Kitasatospora sp. NBC_00085]|uniref:DUF4328 domain-containing protein n=1 Tax=unclassified Kitasatospora TaxID=2633591 RepID=UPI00324C01AA
MDSSQQGSLGNANSAREGAARRRPVSGWAAVATVLISLVLVRELMVAAGNWRNSLLLHDYINGAATDADLEAADADVLTALASSTMLSYLVWLAAGVAFLVWLWRARINAESMSGRDAHRRSRLWVVGAWISPVVNLWYPYQVVSDIWRASAPRRPVSRSLVSAWWAFFLLAGFVKPIQLRMAASEWESEEDVLELANVTTLLAALFVAAGVLLILLIRRVTAWQNQALEAIGGHR